MIEYLCNVYTINYLGKSLANLWMAGAANLYFIHTRPAINIAIICRVPAHPNGRPLDGPAKHPYLGYVFQGLDESRLKFANLLNHGDFEEIADACKPRHCKYPFRITRVEILCSCGWTGA